MVFLFPSESEKSFGYTITTNRKGRTQEGNTDRTPSGNGKAPWIAFILLSQFIKFMCNIYHWMQQILSLSLPGKICWVLVS